jgi:hypothetical protein
MVVDAIANKTDLILTAWRPFIQNTKIESVGLDHIDTLVVKSHKNKPKLLLYYLLFCLQKIPILLEINDDRIDVINPGFMAISEFLWSIIESNKIVLSKLEPNQIHDVETIQFINWEKVVI